MIANGIEIIGFWNYIQGVTYNANDIIYGLREDGNLSIAAVRAEAFVASGDFESDLQYCGGYAHQGTGATIAELMYYLQNSADALRYFKITSNTTYRITDDISPSGYALPPGLYDIRTSVGGPAGFVHSEGFTTLRVYQTDDSILYELMNFQLGTYYTRIFDRNQRVYGDWIELTGSTAASTLLTLSQMIESIDKTTDKLQSAEQLIEDLYRYTDYPILEYFDTASRRLAVFPLEDNHTEIGYILNLSAIIENEDNRWLKQWSVKVLKGDQNNHIYDEFGTQKIVEEVRDGEDVDIVHSVYIPNKVNLISVFAI